MGLESSAPTWEVLQSIFAQALEPGRWALGVARMLRVLCPGQPLYACLLRQGRDDVSVVLDGAGTEHGDWAEFLTHVFRPSLDGARAAAIPSLPSPLRNTRLLQHEIEDSGQLCGVAALAVPEPCDLDRVRSTQALLAFVVDHLEGRLSKEARLLERRELTQIGRLADLSELASVMVHEFNNFLNGALLHLAVLERELPEHLHKELLEIRRQGSQMAGLIKHWHQHRRDLQQAARPVSLNQALRVALATVQREWADLGRTLALQQAGMTQPEATGRTAMLDLAHGLSAVNASPLDIKRLCLFLVRNALLSASSRQGTVRFSTERAKDRAVLRIEDPAADLPVAHLARIFEEAGENWGATSGMELVACKNLVRRLRGKIQAEPRPTGGIFIVVELPAAE